MNGVQPIGPRPRPPYMRTGQLLVAACFVVLTAAACGGTNATAGSGSVLSTSGTAAATTTTSVAPSSPSQPPATAPPAGARTTVPAGQINTSGMAAPPQGVQVTSDGKFVVFNAEQSGCQQISAQTIAQTSTQVTIQVVTTNTSKGNQMCPMIVRVVQVSAPLNAPLGSRTIVFQALNAHK